MTEQEIDGAIEALTCWFESQEITPPDAGIVMLKLIANQFVLKTREHDALINAVRKTNTLLLVEIAGALRRA